MLFQRVKPCLRLFQNYFTGLLQLTSFSNMFIVAEIILELLQSGWNNIIQFQLWLHVK